jgi:hypothetical protein
MLDYAKKTLDTKNSDVSPKGEGRNIHGCDPSPLGGWREAPGEGSAKIRGRTCENHDLGRV